MGFESREFDKFVVNIKRTYKITLPGITVLRDLSKHFWCPVDGTKYSVF